MRGRTMSMGLRGALATATIVVAFGCTSSPITPARIEDAIALTFANLVQVQLSRLDLPPVAATDIEVTASCRKLVAGSGASGAGDWVCKLEWHIPNRQTLRDTYDLSVTTDGCYTATVDAAEGHLGGPTLKASNGSDIRNLTYTFEGCFDTT